MNLERWQALMRAFGFDENQEVYSSLVASYSEKARHYHTMAHVSACLRHFDSVRHLFAKPHEVELALWFHDAIYIPRKSNNELQSAKWAKRFLLDNHAANESVDCVYELIMATLHNAPARPGDEALLVDIDLSILGAPADTYDVFEESIRKEYKWVPSFIYSKKRKEILRGFLERETLYNHEHFIALLENQAKINLRRALENL